MGDFISFKPQDAQLSGYIRFVITKSAFAKIDPSPMMALSILKRFSACKVMMALQGKQPGQIKIFTPDGTFICVEKPEGLLITAFYRNTLLDQNLAMKYGICIRVGAGVIIQIKLQSPYEYYFDIVNGQQLAGNDYADRDVSGALRMIVTRVAQMEKQSASRQEEEEEAEYQPEKKLAALLQLAESYSILSSELEEQQAKMLGNVAYNGVEALEFDRVDRAAYRFMVTNLDEDKFKVGVQVEIEDREQNRHAAEIINLVKEDSDTPATAIDLLLNEQVSITQFNESGWFNLSFSTVNKDVQLAANEKIKTGEAKAKYMDAVFGRQAPGGFDRKDLSAVKSKLQQKKYPPNKSQMDAICSGINSKDVFLVMGPPGTGKTTVILEWVKYFVTQEHKRVLVSSQNNKAVDNVLARIAEEPDIDIIRIGSEAKLQSEVIPFMFENKVASLRRSIAVDSEAKGEAIDQAIGLWVPYLRKMDQANGLRQQAEALQSQLDEAIQRRIAPLYQKLREQYDYFMKTRKLRRACVEKIHKLAKKLRRHEEATNAIIRFFTGLFYRFHLRKMQENVQRLEACRQEMRITQGRYLQLRQRFDETCIQVRDTVFRDSHRMWLRLQQAIGELGEKPARSQEDIWDLFAESRAYVMKDLSGCAEQERLIRQDTAKAQQLKDVLLQWRSDMESKQNYALNEIVLESVDLVGATCIGINSQKRFANLDFDVTIIDEAGQIQVHNALVPMSVSNKLIMLGDHKQIPPTADKDLLELCEEHGVKTELLEKSLFEKMYNDLPASNKMMLDTQYRMPGEIADTISEWFYEGEYYSPPFKRNLKGLIPALSEKPYVVIDTSGEKNRYEKKIEGAGSNNALEASIVADLIRHLASDPDTDLKQIGVISAYKSQVKLIKRELAKFLPKDTVGEMVASLDSYQGQERDIIIYSFTKSSNINPNMRRIGFLNELRRLNVAMTRCKKTLVLIGDMEFLGGCRHRPQDEFGDYVNEGSEYEFSQFIQKMMADVRGGRGEALSYQRFLQKIRGGDKR